ncbi:MAG: methylated-DNA--[protein]-cysteine S-methyltransferase [Gemmatimonadetes bacterium]|nr:methylated-DNA--[protein]-cysteine S-methyltransferase [Gemmatimonadota bacterium]
MSRSPCPVPEDQVLAYVAGDLPEEEELAFAEHLAECDECCEQAAEFVALRVALPACCADDVVRWHSFATPFGTMYVAATEKGLARVSWQQRGPDSFVRELEGRFPGRPVVRDPHALAEAERELREYFGGTRSQFDLPVDLSTLSPFDRRVLEKARTIEFGHVVPYAELARRIARPSAARAVGNALGRNPVAIVVPCHRVVRSDGSLGGYGGGVEYKERLLTIEGRRDLLRAS